MTAVYSRQPVGSQGLEQACEAPPSPTISQCTGRTIAAPHSGSVNPPMPAASGAVAGTLHLSSAEEEQVAAHVRKVWCGATGLSDVPSAEQLAVLVGIILRKAREAISARQSAL